MTCMLACSSSIAVHAAHALQLICATHAVHTNKPASIVCSWSLPPRHLCGDGEEAECTAAEGGSRKCPPSSHPAIESSTVRGCDQRAAHEHVCLPRHVGSKNNNRAPTCATSGQRRICGAAIRIRSMAGCTGRPSWAGLHLPVRAAITPTLDCRGHKAIRSHPLQGGSSYTVTVSSHVMGSTKWGHLPRKGPPTGHIPPKGPPTGHIPPKGPPTGHMPPKGPPTGHIPPKGPPTGHIPP
jgi:hypothetical protein